MTHFVLKLLLMVASKVSFEKRKKVFFLFYIVLVLFWWMKNCIVKNEKWSLFPELQCINLNPEYLCYLQFLN